MGQKKIDKNILMNAVILLCISIFVGFDVANDIKEGIAPRHYIHELILISICFIWMCFQIYLLLLKDRKIKSITDSLYEVSSERDFYKNKVSAVKGHFNQLLDEQFKLWGLTAGERDVSILLIKGMSMKEIADLRETAEGTVRQQAQNIYKKSHLEGRKQLAAYFLDDLFQA